MKTGNTSQAPAGSPAQTRASMEPGHEDREYRPLATRGRHPLQPASMEPGHEDREYEFGDGIIQPLIRPQWSPVMKTGNTAATCRADGSRSRLNGARS